MREMRDNFSGRDASEIYEIHPTRTERRKEENGIDDFERKRSPYSDDFERFDGRKNSREMLVGRARDSPRSDAGFNDNSDTAKRATFKTHMAQKERDRKMEAERRHSVSTHVTDRTEHIEREYNLAVSLVGMFADSLSLERQKTGLFLVKKFIKTSFTKENFNVIRL